jgi:p-aminobenzoyl-glutamate transporter AbgT
LDKIKVLTSPPNYIKIMDALFYGFANACQALFKILPPIGALTNWFFGLTITVGVIYWLWYDAKVRTGGKNYMADKGK